MAILSSTAATNKQRQFTADAGDPDSLSLVAAFLEEDLRFAVDAQVAQALQLELALGGSRPASQTGSIDVCIEAKQESDQLVSLRLQFDLVNPTLPKARIARTAREHSALFADSVIAQQLQQLQAARREEQLDYEFAVAVQRESHAGRESDAGRDSNAVARRGVAAVLGEDTVQGLMVSLLTVSLVLIPSEPAIPALPQNPSAGKKPERPAVPSHEKKEDPRPPTPVPECLFCFALTRAVADPYKNSLSPSSSTAASLGMYLGDRANEHLACLDCLAAYINTQLDDLSGRKAFPICCPLCPYQLTDVDAARILGPENLEAWHHRKLLDALPPFFCPNRSCSTRILLHDAAEEEPQAECPACHKLVCTACESMWHEEYNCDQYQVNFPVRSFCSATLILLAPQYRDAARLLAARAPISNPATPQAAEQAELNREHKLELLDFVLQDYGQSTPLLTSSTSAESNL
ncbi:hypothetical protein JCM21900_005319 [Sporobolomyces salmonicolor]